MTEADRREWVDATRRRMLAVLVALVLMVGLTVANVGYISHVHGEAERRAAEIQRENDQRWCSLLGQYVRAYADRPPETELGRTIAAELERLWRSFGCA